MRWWSTINNDKSLQLLKQCLRYKQSIILAFRILMNEKKVRNYFNCIRTVFYPPLHILRKWNPISHFYFVATFAIVVWKVLYFSWFFWWLITKIKIMAIYKWIFVTWSSKGDEKIKSRQKVSAKCHNIKILNWE